ncbi:MAG: chemotaxis protein CheC [Thermotogaceae bacterium]|nr:chemotaxis protein CheC [Thermotogaceae bacterium]
MYDRMEDKHLDLLKEIGNVGAGNAATALSMMIDKKVEIAVPDVKIVPIAKVPFMLPNPEELVAGVKMDVSGDVEMETLLIFDSKGTKELIKLLTMGMSVVEDITQIGEMEKSAIKEVGNIICGSYITALANFTGFFLNPQPPDISVDMISAIVAETSLKIAHTDDKIILIETLLNIQDVEITGYIFMIPEEESLKKIFESMGLM